MGLDSVSKLPVVTGALRAYLSPQLGQIRSLIFVRPARAAPSTAVAADSPLLPNVTQGPVRHLVAIDDERAFDERAVQVNRAIDDGSALESTFGGCNRGRTLTHDAVAINGSPAPRQLA